MRAVDELKATKQPSEQPEEEGAADGGARGQDSTSTATFNMQQVGPMFLCRTLNAKMSTK
jgi:hypothetical protein